MKATGAAEPLAARRLAQLFLATAIVAATMLALRPVQARAVADVQARSRSTQVRVQMKEFRFILSVRSVHVGVVVFRLVNRGHLAHDFKIAGKRSALIAAGKQGLLRVTFKRAGTYPYVCTVPGHAAAGMKGALKVTG